MANSLTCPNCGGLIVDTGEEYGVCESCGSQIKIRDVRKKASYAQRDFLNQENTYQSQNKTQSLPVTSFGSVVTGEKSVGLAVILSILIIGVGVMYAGAIGKGILYLVLSILFCWTFVVPIIIWILGIYKAYTFATENNILWAQYRGA